MFSKLTDALAFQSQALVLRAERQRLIASNIANADTPGYVARDFDFRQAMEQATRPADASSTQASEARMARFATHSKHLNLQSRDSSIGQALAYTPVAQPSMDNNTVDLDRERSNFTDNAIRYESTLRFVNGYSKTILSAIQGQ
jgi:flagellar basal-body rod protein FlgB